MNSLIVGLFITALTWRIYTVVVSRHNERGLRSVGAREYGVGNSKLLKLLHCLFYFAALVEAYVRNTQPDTVTFVGVGLYGISVVVLLLVWYDLGEIWTVKLFIAPDHKVVDTWLFRSIRHPNYFFSILPELVGLCLMLHAWTCLLVGLPIYGACLAFRIRVEERVMHEHFRDYR